MITKPLSIPGSRFTVADRCGARARVLVLLRSGGELLFCGHHDRMRRPALEPIADCFEDRVGRAADTAPAA